VSSIPLSLYVHIPWCIKKCPYCDFNSHEAREALPEKEYIDALITDLRTQADQLSQQKLISIFIGGGTPSLFSASSISRLLNEINKTLTLADNAEITLEANPGTLDQKNFSGFYAAGVNRISIGTQSFSNTQLQALGRVHDNQAAIDAVAVAKQAGFNNINIDLMHGLPQQSLAEAKHDIQQAIELEPKHISYYQLTIEPNTRFYQHPPALPNNELCWQIQEQGKELLAEHGYQQYEVSAYAQDNYMCRHNQNYWQFGDYLGIGAGAHQKLSFKNKIVRSEKPPHPQQYMRSISDAANPPSKTLSEQEIMFEFLLNALRLRSGFSIALFESHTLLQFKSLQARLKDLLAEGLLLQNDTQIYASDRGYRYLDEVLQRLLPG